MTATVHKAPVANWYKRQRDPILHGERPEKGPTLRIAQSNREVGLLQVDPFIHAHSVGDMCRTGKCKDCGRVPDKHLHEGADR